MDKPRKIILAVCMSLIGLIILLVHYIHTRDISKYEERGITVKAIIDKKESETTQETRTTVSTKNMLWVHALIGKDSVLSLLSEYIDNDMWEKYKKDDIVEIVYLPEDYYRNYSTGTELEGKQILKPALLAAKARLPWYYLYAAICFFLGFLPYILKRKKVS
jgi:hypothetical protein